MDCASGLMGHLIASLPPSQRSERYRHLAAKTITMAQAETNPDRRTEYLTLAAGWHSLALEAERLLARSAPEEVPEEDEYSEVVPRHPH